MTRIRIGSVPYLNACVLTDGLAGRDDVELCRAKPSALAGMLAGGEVDVALMPSVDYWDRRETTRVAAAYGIVSCGAIWTVKIFSRPPLERVSRLYVDAESHSSVMLANVLLCERGQRGVEFVPRSFQRESVRAGESWLLIGDKALAGIPRPYVYDLGQMWHDETDLPFVFALWVSRRGEDDDRADRVLSDLAERNLNRIDDLAERYGPAHGFEIPAAREYLRRVVRYRIGPREFEGLERFGRLLAKHSLQRAPA